MLLSDIENAARLDLFDPTGSNQRWTNQDLDRAINKAVDRYSQCCPNLLYGDMASQPFQRTYPYPQSWNPNYPVLWIERILYPLQLYGSYFNPPSSGPTTNAVAGTALGIGLYQYAITFISQGGETTPSPISSITTTTNNQVVNLSNIPLGLAQPSMPGIPMNTVIGRNVYRSLLAGGQLYLLATIQDNVTTALSDTTPDSALAAMPAVPAVNTSGIMYYPPRECSFAEHSNIRDSTAALAAGGNQGNMGSVGVNQSITTPSFTLMLNNADLPQDNTLIIRIFYATRHQLDTQGSTIPEIHRDIVVLGATAYAMEAYQVPTNDNFAFQDGSLHDRVDDTKIPAAWTVAARNRMSQFIARLEEIKEKRDFAASIRIAWGDVPHYWTRL